MCKFEDARGGRDATCASNMDASSRLPEDDVRGYQRHRDEDVGWGGDGQVQPRHLLIRVMWQLGDEKMSRPTTEWRKEKEMKTLYVLSPTIELDY